jgi:glycosyltransferase involved in cell wall biosynthesis
MRLPVYILDPTAGDEASRVRGIGRYIQILREHAPEGSTFVSSIHEVPYDSVFIMPFYNFLAKPIAFRRIARKQIAVIHDLIPFKYPKQFPLGMKGLMLTSLNRFSLGAFDMIITDSEASRDDIRDMLDIPERALRVLYPPVPRAFAAQARKTEGPIAKESLPKQPYCLYVGDVTWNKNLVNLAKAIKIADIRCVFAGKHFIKSKMNIALVNRTKAPNPWLDELYGFYEEVQTDERFRFHGFVSDEYLVELYKGAVCNILPSRDEGFGFSFLEAGVCGTPSVLADIPVFRETAGDSALFAHPEDPIEIADKIRRMYVDKERTVLKKQVRERVKRYAASVFADGLSKVLEEVMV